MTTRRGLTLIELLIVVAVLAALLAVMLPAVQRVRGAASRLSDANRLRQVGVAMHHYIGERGHFPPYFTNEPGLWRAWYGSLPVGPDGEVNDTVAVDRTSGHLSPYLGDALGPLVPGVGPSFSTEGGATGGFGYNIRGLNRPNPLRGRWDGRTITSLTNISATVAFANAALLSLPPIDAAGERSDVGVPIEFHCIQPPSRNNPLLHFRQHGRTCNVLWADGRVEAWREGTRNPGVVWPTRHDLDRYDIFDLGSTDELWGMP